MIRVPDTENTLLIRTDFSDQAAWDRLCKTIATPNADGFRAYVDIVDDRAFADANLDDADLGTKSLVIVADARTLSDRDHPFLCINVATRQSIRVIASELWSIENNLSIANMDFDEFVTTAGADGVFRGF